MNRLAIAASWTVALVGGAALAQTPARMRAVVHEEYGSPAVLHIVDLDRPVPAEDQILVRVRAASVNPLDWHVMEGTPYLARPIAFGLLRPQSLRIGVDFAGTVEAVGKGVTDFKPGDDVFGGKTGAFAEYVLVPASGAVVVKPAQVTFEQAACLPIAAITALQALRDDGKLRAGQRVLINGASGGVGTFAVQLAKSFGAHVTGVSSTRNLDLVRSIGADQVIDYTKEDFTEGAERYDLIIDNVGNRSLLACRRVLTPAGKYILVGGGGADDNHWIGPVARMLRALVLSRLVDQELRMLLADMNKADLTVLADMVQAGKLKPVIDRRYPFADVAEALRYVETGHARGKVVITFDPGTDATPPAVTGASDDRPGPLLIAFALIGIPAAVMIAPIFLALALDRRFRRLHPGKRPFRWGYYFSIESVVGGIVLGILLEAGLAGVLACGVGYGALAWFFARRRRWAWLTLTIFSFNPVAWVINGVYLWKRWAEEP